MKKTEIIFIIIYFILQLTISSKVSTSTYSSYNLYTNKSYRQIIIILSLQVGIHCIIKSKELHLLSNLLKDVYYEIINVNNIINRT